MGKASGDEADIHHFNSRMSVLATDNRRTKHMNEKTVLEVFSDYV